MSENEAYVFNLTEALERVEGDMELLCELIDIFLEEYPQMLAAIEQAVITSDPQALQYSAHTLKGSVSNFAASGAATASFALEQMGKQQELSQASAALSKLKNELERLGPALAILKDKEAA